MQGKKFQINCRVQTQGRGVPKIRGAKYGGMLDMSFCPLRRGLQDFRVTLSLSNL
jgi:hypothetical protein